VFGRGTFGGGQFNSHLASAVAQVCGSPSQLRCTRSRRCDAAQDVGCSLAVFAPGWTHECPPDGLEIEEYASSPSISVPRMRSHQGCSCDALLWSGLEWPPIPQDTRSLGDSCNVIPLIA
jgi:hypothetical protein